MQQALVQLRPLSGERDAWEWENAPFSVHKAYKRIQERQWTNDERKLFGHVRLVGSKKFH